MGYQTQMELERKREEVADLKKQVKQFKHRLEEAEAEK